MLQDLLTYIVLVFVIKIKNGRNDFMALWAGRFKKELDSKTNDFW